MIVWNVIQGTYSDREIRWTTLWKLKVNSLDNNGILFKV